MAGCVAIPCISVVCIFLRTSIAAEKGVRNMNQCLFMFWECVAHQNTFEHIDQSNSRVFLRLYFFFLRRTKDVFGNDINTFLRSRAGLKCFEDCCLGPPLLHMAFAPHLASTCVTEMTRVNLPCPSTCMACLLNIDMLETCSSGIPGGVPLNMIPCFFAVLGCMYPLP